MSKIPMSSNSMTLKPASLATAADVEKTVAEMTLGRLLSAPLPQTVQEFRQHTLMALLTGRQIEADLAEDDSWQTTPPDKPGTWAMRSRETSFEPEPVVVQNRTGELWAVDTDVGTLPVLDLHHNLTSIRWRFIARP